MKNQSPYYLVCFLVLMRLIASCANDTNNETKHQDEYVPASIELFDEIKAQDSALFAAYNNHDLEKCMRFFSDSLEFYHDAGGLSGYQQTREGLGSVFKNEKTADTKRELVQGTLEVYPVKDYGAIETGLHTFCHTENGKQDCGTFKFLHIWQKKDGNWKITRVASYGHKLN